jgi:hypothetical protein
MINEVKDAAVHTAAKVFLKVPDPLKIIKVDGKINIGGKIFSYLLPLLIRLILLRRQGFFMRLIVTMAARQIGKSIGPELLDWLLRKISGHLRQSDKPVLYLSGRVDHHQPLPTTEDYKKGH